MGRGRQFQSKPRQTVRKDIEITAKTEGQQDLINAISTNDLVICSGPAGTGKSTISVGMALKLLRDHPEKYRKIIMVRPYVSIPGEEIGFLPGDADTKMRPFMMPLLDGLQNFIDMGSLQTMLGHGVIEFLPVAHARGRSLKNCVVIFDEAQNSRVSHMRMFLTRLGENCKAIVEGDIDQSDLDLDEDEDTGLEYAMDRLVNIQGVKVLELGDEDIVRSALVKRIIGRL